MKNIFDPKEFNFKESIHYPEIHDFFGGKTFVKAIAEHNNGKDHFYFYRAIKIPIKSFASDERYLIYSGVFKKGQPLSREDYPKEVYDGLIFSKEFGEQLLMNLLGTLSTESVLTEGKSRLHMNCCYLDKKD